MKEWTCDNTDEFSVLTRQQVRRFDAWAMDSMNIPGVVLMENAGRSCASLVLQMLEGKTRPKVCIFCGAGNNGGDGFVIARQLCNADVAVKIVVCANPAKIEGDAKIHYEICRNMHLPIQVLDVESDSLCVDVEKAAQGCDFLVDAIFGTGLAGELRSAYAVLISCINSHNIPIVAVDIPSGLDCDTGLPLPVCIEAKATVTFVAIKKGFTQSPESRRATGRVFVADIGITPQRPEAQKKGRS